MGGCCFASKSVPLDGGQQGSQNDPHASLDHEPVSLHHGISVESTDVLVDTNLGTNTEILPSAETLDVGVAQTPDGVLDTSDKTYSMQTADAEPIEDTVSGMHEELKRSDVGIIDDPLSGPPEDEKNSKLEGPFPFFKDEEDVCPICLEEYTRDNPSIVTGCRHNFHLACIMEWTIKSGTCAICNEAM